MVSLKILNIQAQRLPDIAAGGILIYYGYMPVIGHLRRSKIFLLYGSI